MLKLKQREHRYLIFEENLKVDKENRKKNFENIIKTTAEKRAESYFNTIGLPQSYGSNAPFKPFDSLHNLRHFQKKEN